MRVERSVEAKSHRSSRAWLYSKSHGEGFGGMQSGVLEKKTPVGAWEEGVGGGQEAITESCPVGR